MTRMSFTIQSDADRNHVADLVRTLKDGMRVEIKQGKRSPEQSALMWARLHDIAEQAVWHGQKLEPVDWKDMFTAGLRRARIVPNIDGDGFVQLGLHTSDLTKEEMSNLLDLMDAFAAQRGVTFKENSNSSDATQAGDRSDTPAADTALPRAVDPVAGVSNWPEDWFDQYVAYVGGPIDRADPISLRSLHTEAVKVLGDRSTENQRAIIKQVWSAIRDRNEGAITASEYELRISKAKSIAMGTRHAA